MSLIRTYKMPCRHSQSSTGRGPGDRSGQSGSSGSTSSHRASSTVHGHQLVRTSASPSAAAKSRRSWGSPGVEVGPGNDQRGVRAEGVTWEGPGVGAVIRRSW